MGPPLLDVRDLTVSYDTDDSRIDVVRNVSMAIAPGEAVGLVGESGSGKSTVAAAILDLLGPGATIRNGSMAFEGGDLVEMPSRERRRLLGSRIGAVFQDPFTSLNPSMRVGAQIAEPLIQHRGVARMDALSHARTLLSEMGLEMADQVAAAYPHQLSGGMKQRALIAMAMACEPALLILDEPTTALDVTIEAQILDLLAGLRARKNVSLLFISHNLAVVRTICDTVNVLYAGEIMERGQAQKVLQRARHPYTKGLLASIPRIAATGRKRRLATIAGHMPQADDLPPGCSFGPRCAFVEDRCRAEAQALVPSNESREAVRCWKADRLEGRSWPVSEDSAQPQLSANPAHAAYVASEGLTKHFGRPSAWRSVLTRAGLARHRQAIPAVDDVTLEIARGEVLGLVGESGSGKSTLGRVLLRLIEPTGGRVLVEGRDITQLSRDALKPLRRDIQIVFQNPDSSLNPRMSVGAILARPLRLFRIEGDRRRDVDELLEMVRLPAAYARRFPHQLSGGEKQRVGIARALAGRPRFLVCDEAVSALDVSVQAAIINLLADLRSKFDLAMLFISHDLSVVGHLADRVAVMQKGRICEIGATDQILTRPIHPYTRKLLASLPRLDADETYPTPNAAGRSRYPHLVQCSDPGGPRNVSS